MKYLLFISLSFYSLLAVAQEVDSAMIYIEREFYEYDLPDSNPEYLDSTYKTEYTTGGIIGGLGYNDGLVVELGYGKSFNSNIKNRTSFQSFYGGIEILPSTNNTFVMAPKAAIWIEESTYMTAVGLNLLYYTDFNQSTIRLRPELGVGIKRMKLTYGYNVSLVKGDLDVINKHNIGLAYFFETRKKEAKRTTYRQLLKEQKEDYRNGAYW